ncbi:MAG: cyclic nucleotide-binding domain-containing protein [Acidobacteriaceae bacterium]|nr:cyclic nucleotide-binding domain-containing protein [Acidobacteriaceae bacterium]
MNRIEELARAAEAYPLLADLRPEHLAKLVEIAEERSFEQDEIIFGEGATSECLFLIASGKIALETIAGGKRIVIQTLSAGDAMGWSALTHSAKTHFQARALSHVQTIAFEGAKLAVACEYDPVLGYEIMKRLLALVTERLDHTRMQVVDMYGKRAAARS